MAAHLVVVIVIDTVCSLQCYMEVGSCSHHKRLKLTQAAWKSQEGDMWTQLVLDTENWKAAHLFSEAV